MTDGQFEGIDNTENQMSASDYMVAFSGQTQNYCVGIVDMINSTKMAATLGNAKISKIYPVSSNSQSQTLEQFIESNNTKGDVGVIRTHYSHLTLR